MFIMRLLRSSPVPSQFFIAQYMWVFVLLPNEMQKGTVRAATFKINKHFTCAYQAIVETMCSLPCTVVPGRSSSWPWQLPWFLDFQKNVCVCVCERERDCVCTCRVCTQYIPCHVSLEFFSFSSSTTYFFTCTWWSCATSVTLRPAQEQNT